jgi:hypothetical protein
LAITEVTRNAVVDLERSDRWKKVVIESEHGGQ